MKVFPIETPLDGERVVGVEPGLSRLVDLDELWRKRVNHFTGRSLTHTALSSEQAGRSGRVAALGQLLSPGVIQGLVADVSRELNGSATTEYLYIGAGNGISSHGETVTLNRPLRVDLRDVPVYAAVTDLDPAPSSDPSDTDTGSTMPGDTTDTSSDSRPSTDPGVPTGLAGMLARRMGPELGQAIDQGLDLPRVAILVLQPVQIEMNLQRQQDPCALDPQQYAYENWQLVDGVRPLLYCWPEEVISLPSDFSAADWRNRIAHAIFDFENNLHADEQMPWMEQGVPLAVIGFDTAWQVRFIDRNAAVRAGGRRRRTNSLLNNRGNRWLWQARFEQFNEHLVDILSGLDATDNPPLVAASRLRHLPPVGVLPRGFIDLETQAQSFFPLSYRVEAVAVPYEQLDVVVQESASLQPFDFHRADRVQALVPVPQVYFEPNLLRTETIDAEFDATVNAFVEDRDQWLGRRLELRRKMSRLRQVMVGRPIGFTYPDPAAVDDSELATPFEQAPVDFGEVWRYHKGRVAPPEDWFDRDFDDSDWSSGPGGFGLGSAGVETELADMSGAYLSVFTRVGFSHNVVDATRALRLEVVTSGGFIAYLNGQEFARANLDDDSFDTAASREQRAELRVYELDETSLIKGPNVLAVQAHAAGLKTEGFVVSARLVEKQFVAQLEDNDYGLTVRTDAEGEPVLTNAEPEYQVAEVEALKEYFNKQTYTDDQGDSQRIWSLDDIKAFMLVESDGLQGFIDHLNENVNKANDKVDFGFVRLQTDIYRVRQFVLGNEQATKLATSPVLASIAKGDTAVATKEEIGKIASVLSQQTKVDVAFNGNPEDGSGGALGTVKKARTNNLALNARNDVFISGDLSEEALLGQDLGLKDSGGSTANINTNLIDRDVELRSGGKQVLEESSQSDGLLLATAKEVEEQNFIIGTYPFFRNVTVGERLEQPVTNEAVDAGRATKAETITNIQSTGISMDGIKVPGFKTDAGEETLLNFKDINGSVIGDILGGKHDPVESEDEATRFNAGVRALENTAALLRLTEGRIKAYKLLIEQCNEAMRGMRSTQTRIDSRLKQIEDELAEARHDVAVSRSLRAEELERIDSINQRRESILDEHVPFLMFRRPRLSDVLVDAPVVNLKPDLSEVPLPVCNVDEDEIPEEIAALIDEIREAPLRWFRFADKLMKRINRPADLTSLLKGARTRALNRKTRHRLINRQYQGLNRLAAGIDQSLKSFSRVIDLQRKQVAALDLVAHSRFGWAESGKRATRVISLGDVIDGNHGRMGASKLAAQELERLSHGALCLYLQFVQVLPSIRLDWAERLSQFDAPVNLRNLHTLPRWSEIDYIERQQIQRLVDGLYGRIDGSFSDAADMISELIRVAILLASHAPVNKLISGLVPEPRVIKPGSIIDVIADLARVRIGMNLALVTGRNTVARGTVTDIVDGRIKTEITSTLKHTLQIEKNTRVQIGEPRITGGRTYQRNLALLRR